MWIYFILGFTKKTLREAPHGVAAAFIIFSVCCAGTSSRWSTAASVAGMGVAFLFSLTVRGATLARRLTAPALFSILLCAVNISLINVYAALTGSTDELMTFGTPERYSLIISSKILVIFAVFITLRLLRRDVAFAPRDLILYILFPVVSISIQLCITHMAEQAGVSALPLWVVFPMLGLVIINFVTIFIFERMGEQAKEKAELQLLHTQTEFEKGKYEELQALHERLRAVRHDFSNHITYLHGMMDMGEHEKARAYLDTLCEEAQAGCAVITTGHRTLDFILNSKISANTAVSFKICGNVDALPDSSLDLVVLMGNVLDNAIESAKKCPEPLIEIEFFAAGGYQSILCKNTCPAPVLRDNPHLTTTKKDADLHGLGVKNIKRITEKYAGIADFYEEDGKFCVHIALPKEDNNDQGNSSHRT